MERYALPVLRLQQRHDGLQLLLDDLCGLVRLTLGESLTDAKDDGEPLVEGDAGLLGDELGGLVEDGATLRVAEDDVGDLCVDELGGAREGGLKGV